MSARKRPETAYYHRGRIERGNGHGYTWHEAYSVNINNATSYPWLLRRECQQEAAARGCKAVFYDRNGRRL